MPGNQTFLILGGARSGKSSFALSLAERFLPKGPGIPPQGLFIATAQALDEEMTERIAAHQKERGPAWHTQEEAILLADTVRNVPGDFKVILVDCLTMWLSNLLLSGKYDIAGQILELAEAVSSSPKVIIMVSNEVGLGLVPENYLGRRFRELQGRLNQEIARACSSVVFVAAGLPLILKGDIPGSKCLAQLSMKGNLER